MSSSSSSSSILLTFIILVPLFSSHLHAFGDGGVEAGESMSSVVFIDSHTHPYLRTTTTTTTTTQDNLMSVNEVGAAVSILLGLPPTILLSTSTSSKLNQLLMPNPFDRPRHVLMLEVALAKGSLATLYPNGGASVSGSAITRKVISTSTSAHIQLPDTEEVVLSPLYGSDYDAHKYVTHEEISDFAQSFGGSYVSSNFEAMNGELIIPLPSGLQINLHMSKKADQEFASALIYMIKHIRKVIGMSQDNVAELLQGYFDGVKGLQEEYGSKDVSLQAMELLVASISKVFESLHAEHQGEIVAVILLKEVESRMVDVTFDARQPSSRWLGEVNTTTSKSIIIAQVLLVRTTLAWITGLVLLIATIIGVYLLLNMPLTRDTLLYSNVKLD